MSLARSERQRWRSVVGALCVGLAWVGSASGDDESSVSDEARALTEWLSQAGLDGLLASALEEELAKAPSVSPSTVARLTEAYIRLLKEASDEDRLADLRARVLKFLSEDRHPDEVQLRLALARADYKLAQRDLEQLRQGSSDKALRNRAIEAIARARAPLAQYITLLGGRIDEDRRLAAGADEAQRQLALEQQDSHQQQLLEAKFLRNWCDYWELWLRRGEMGASPLKPAVREEMVLSLLRAWAEILETGMPFPEPDHTSVDLRGEEYYAQSILGMALTKAIKGPIEISDGWFELLGSEGIWPGLADHNAWKLHALVDAGEYGRAADLIVAAVPPIDPSTAVGVAMRSAVESCQSPASIVLAQRALEVAAAQGNLAAARKLGKSIPELAQGAAFTAAMLRGVEAYEAGRAAGAAPSAKSSFAVAATELAKAVELAPTGSKAIAAIEELLAWAQLGAARHCDAAQAFESASARLSGNRADESLWMAVRSADLGECAATEKQEGRRSGELASLYLKLFPEGNHSQEAMAVLSKSPEAQKDASFVKLLEQTALQPGAPVSVREAAATLLYRRFRGAHGDLRLSEARRLLGIPGTAPVEWPKGTVDLLTRQQLEAALDPAVRELGEARRLLAEIAAQYPEGREPALLKSELALRRLSLAIEERDLARALAALTAVRFINDSAWRPVGEALFVAGIERMVAEGAINATQGPLVASTITEARRSLRDSVRKLADVAKADVASVALGRALIEEARAIRVSSGSGENDQLAQAAKLDREALAIANDVLAHRLDDASAVSLKADAALACGDFDAAYEALSRLVGGLPERSDEWFVRKAELCELLARTDPEGARKALAQHAVLMPEWGPGEGGKRLRALAERMGVVPPRKGVEP